MQDPHIYRPLDPGEAFFTMSDDVSCMNFVVFAERLGQLSPQDIRSALDQIQLENQLLQTRISWTEAHGLCFTHAPGCAIELRCHEVGDEGWQGLIEQQLSEPFAAGTAPLVRCLYLEKQPANHPQNQPQPTVLALCFHHSVADGRSGTELLRRLLGLMASSTTPIEPKGPTALPTMAELHPARFRWAQQPDAAKQLRKTVIGDYRRFGPPATIAWLTSETTGRTPRFIQLKLAPEITQRLVARARERGSSVHGALCAAQLLAQRQLQPGGEPDTVLLSCPVDMRAHLEPVQPVVPTSLFVSLISATFLIRDDTDMWQLARDIITQTRLQIARGEGHLFFQLYGLDGSPMSHDQMEVFKNKTAVSLPNTMVSNVGPIATVTNDPAVESISFALCPMPYQTLFTAASTYKGQLVLNMGYDAARMTATNAHDLSQGMAQILRAAASGS